MDNCVIAYNPCFSCDEKKCEICELDMHRKRVFKQSEGEWKKRGNEKTCSLCKFIYYSNNDEWNYCPNCGAKMKGAEQ